jgi:glycerol-3-phosphate dehydrogenase
MRKLSVAIGAVIATTCGGMILCNPSNSASNYGCSSHLETLRKKLHAPDIVVPSRETLQSALMAANKANPLDVLVIGGGATGTGAALDATTRGLKVGLVEREDFA